MGSTGPPASPGSCEQLKSDFEKFLLFQCENKPINPDDLIASTINLLDNCASARSAILQFYTQLFDELCYLHAHGSRRQVITEQHLLHRFLSYYETQKSGVSKVFRVSESNGGTTTSSDAVTPGTPKDTPMSPPLASKVSDLPDSPKDPSSPSAAEPTLDTDCSFAMLINRLNQQTSGTLRRLLLEQEAHTDRLVIDWSLQLLSTLPAKYNNLASRRFKTGAFKIASGHLPIADTISIWIDCKIIQALLNLVIFYVQQMPNSDQSSTYALSRLLQLSPESDWICAYLLTSINNASVEQSLLQCCINLYLPKEHGRTGGLSDSTTNIFSFMSEKNPKAVITALKENIPFLLRLSATSQPLLNLLSEEAMKEVNANFLNRVSTMLANEDDLKVNVLNCILHAPNAFDLLCLVFQFCLHPDANTIVQQQAYFIAQLVLKQLHQFVYNSPKKASPPCLPIMDVFNQKLEQLVRLFVQPNSNDKLRQIQMRILHLCCLHFGQDFTTLAFHHILNNLNVDYNFRTQVEQSNNKLIVQFLDWLKLSSFGFQVYDLLKNTLDIADEKKPCFWANLLELMTLDSNLDINLKKLTEKFSNIIQDESNLFSIFYVLKIICICLESGRYSFPNHHLCISLVACYDHVLSSKLEPEQTHIKAGVICVIHACIRLLSHQHSANQHILSRALIELELNVHEIKPFIKADEFDESSVCLLSENFQYGTTLNYRKIPLVSSLRDSINQKPNTNLNLSKQQYVFDAIRYCVGDNLQLLAELLVELVTPDVMFNDNKVWPDEDFLKVTIERDLHIARMFESHTILWNLSELIAKGGYLRHCSVLVRALIAVQITQWLSATAVKDKKRLHFTDRLLKLIAKSELVPNHPFAHLHLTLPYLEPYEIYCLMNDLWKYLKEAMTKNESCEKYNFPSTKPYLERLRLISANRLPGEMFVKIFHSIK